MRRKGIIVTRIQKLYLSKVTKILGYHPNISEEMLEKVKLHPLCKKFEISAQDFIDAGFWAFPVKRCIHLFNVPYPIPTVYCGIRAVSRALDFIRTGRFSFEEETQYLETMEKSAKSKLQEFAGKSLGPLVSSGIISPVEAAVLHAHVPWTSVSKKLRKEVQPWLRKIYERRFQNGYEASC